MIDIAFHCRSTRHALFIRYTAGDVYGEREQTRVLRAVLTEKLLLDRNYSIVKRFLFKFGMYILLKCSTISITE